MHRPADMIAMRLHTTGRRCTLSWGGPPILRCLCCKHALHGRVFSAGVTPDTPPIEVAACEAVTGLVIAGVFLALPTQRFFEK